MYSFHFFVLPFASSRTSTTEFATEVERGTSLSCFDLREKVLSVKYDLSLILSLFFVFVANLYQIEKTFFLVPSLLRRCFYVFNHKRVLYFVKCFFCILN